MTIDFLLAKGESNADILISLLPGKFDGKMPIGDVIGKTEGKGTIGDTGFKVSVIVNVVEQDYISNVSIGYFEMLDSHVIMVGVSRDVHIDTVNDINAHYEGDNQFSLNTSEKISGSNVKIQIYDKYGKLLETKMNKLVVY